MLDIQAEMQVFQIILRRDDFCGSNGLGSCIFWSFAATELLVVLYDYLHTWRHKDQG